MKKDKKCIYAPIHNSSVDGFFIPTVVNRLVLILKKELMYIPFFNICFIVSRMIFIDRSLSGGGKSILTNTLEKVKKSIDSNMNIAIFPAGTRSYIRERKELKRGIYFFYKNLNSPVIPVSTNISYFFGKGFLGPKRSGNIIIEFMEPIEPGLGKEEFFDRLSNSIYEGSDKLLYEVMDEDDRAEFFPEKMKK